MDDHGSGPLGRIIVAVQATVRFLESASWLGLAVFLLIVLGAVVGLGVMGLGR